MPIAGPPRSSRQETAMRRFPDRQLPAGLAVLGRIGLPVAFLPHSLSKSCASASREESEGGVLPGPLLR